MKRISFVQGALLAFVFALMVAVSLPVLASVFGLDSVGRALVIALGGAYLAYLLGRAQEKIGRLVVPLSWLAVSSLSLIFVEQFALFVLCQTAVIWIVRSLYFHQGILDAVGDFALNLAALAAAWGTALHTGNAFLVVWAFFLVQALFVTINTHKTKHSPRPRVQRDERFDRAKRNAENALRRLHQTH